MKNNTGTTSTNDDGNYQESSDSIEQAKEEDEETKKKEKEEAQIKAEEREKQKKETEAILEHYTIIDSKTNNPVTPKLEELESASKIHLIAGSFSRLVNAEQEQQRLIKLGFNNAKVLPLNNKMYRVSIDVFEKVEQAVKDFDRIKAVDASLDVWLLIDK